MDYINPEDRGSNRAIGLHRVNIIPGGKKPSHRRQTPHPGCGYKIEKTGPATPHNTSPCPWGFFLPFGKSSEDRFYLY